MMHIIEALLLLISGIYYPISVLPDWLQIFWMLSPTMYVLCVMRDMILSDKSTAELLPDIWPLALTGLIMVPLQFLVFGVVE